MKKGLDRGGIGQERELEKGNLEQGNLEQRPGWQQEQGNLRRKDQRGGLQREPNLNGREEETGHEVD